MKTVLTLICFLLASQSLAKNEKFTQVLKEYEKVHQAFFDDDFAKAKELSKGLLKAVKSMEDEKAKKTLAFSEKKLEEMLTQEDKKEAHKAFNVVSQGILVVLEKQMPIENYARYYCPMVKKYWIQNTSKSEKVLNPYASKSMPHCGGKI